jgi:cobyrinic acid a,c-diamide synthase
MNKPVLGPRLVIAGTHSGVGKTTVATGLMAALRGRGVVVGSAKVGPDFIDPGYHRLATGRTGRNLDSFLCGPRAIAPLAAKAAAGADLLVVEGVMGLFDGLGTSPTASTAEVAHLLDAPTVLVVDAASMSSSVRALVEGFHQHLLTRWSRPLSGVILNRVGSDNHETLLRAALADGPVPVLGALRRDPALSWRDRHLGLVPVAEDAVRVRASIDALADVVRRSVDLDAMVQVGTRARRLVADPLPRARRVTDRPVRIAVVSGRAFSFAYPDNLERLEEAGGELIDVDPLTDRALPEGTQGLYACGGFPEIFAEQLEGNAPLRTHVAGRVGAGMATWAECGGLLWLARSLDGHRLCGAIPADGTMGSRVLVGYRTATLRTDTPIGPTGTVLCGHEHHYSTLEPAGTAMELAGRVGSRLEGWATPRLLATYLHLHLGADPTPAERFVACAAAGPPQTRPGAP